MTKKEIVNNSIIFLVSALSLSKENGSISIISNQDIWNINNRKEDSKEFLEQIEKLKQGKKKKRKNVKIFILLNFFYFIAK